MVERAALYDDGRIACYESAIRIRWYYPWGAKTIPYRVIRGVHDRPLSNRQGKWRVWGSGDFTHWYNLDPGRPAKSTALELDVGGHVRPTITPDDPDAVARIIESHLRG